MYFFVQKSNRMAKKIGQTFFTIMIEINAFLVISEALNFKIFWSGCPLDNLAPSVLISNNPKYAVWSLKVKYTILLIPIYLEVGIIGRCGKKEFKLFVRDTVFLWIMPTWFEELPVILHTDSLLSRLNMIFLWT